MYFHEPSAVYLSEALDPYILFYDSNCIDLHRLQLLQLQSHQKRYCGIST